MELRQVIFCDFGNPKADSRNYGEIQELENLRSTVERYHDEYNNMSRKPTELVLFRYKFSHMIINYATFNMTYSKELSILLFQLCY